MCDRGKSARLAQFVPRVTRDGAQLIVDPQHRPVERQKRQAQGRPLERRAEAGELIVLGGRVSGLLLEPRRPFPPDIRLTGRAIFKIRAKTRCNLPPPRVVLDF